MQSNFFCQMQLSLLTRVDLNHAIIDLFSLQGESTSRLTYIRLDHNGPQVEGI